MKNEIYRVLLIEDDIDHAALITRQLKHAEGYCVAVVHVSSMQQASEAARDQEFDAVLVEVNLPDCSVKESILALKDTFPETPVVALTCLRDISIAKYAIDNGFVDYLVKTELSGSLICKSVYRSIENARLKKQVRKLQSELYDCKQALDGALLTSVSSL